MPSGSQAAALREPILLSRGDVPVNPFPRRQERKKKNHQANADTTSSEGRLVVTRIFENDFACPQLTGCKDDKIEARRCQSKPRKPTHEEILLNPRQYARERPSLSAAHCTTVPYQ